MTTATHTEREEFVLTLARHRPRTENHHTQRLMRYASGYSKLKTRALDGHAIILRDQLKLQRIKSAITEICQEIECEPQFCGSLFLLVDTGEFSKLVEVPRI